MHLFLLAARVGLFAEGRFLGRVVDEWAIDAQNLDPADPDARGPLPMPSWRTAPAHDETALVDADPRGSRRRSDPADFRVAPDPPGHGEAPHFHGKRLAEVKCCVCHSRITGREPGRGSAIR